jgi:hypothetical protein
MRAVILSFALCFSGAAVAANSYLCISDHATGFAFNKATGQWHEANFQAGTKYLLSKQAGGWVLKEFGNETPVVRCPKDFNDSSYLICGDGSVDFRMNRHVLRFQKAQLLGYYVDYDALNALMKNAPGYTPLLEGGDTPALEIGKCTPL